MNCERIDHTLFMRSILVGICLVSSCVRMIAHQLGESPSFLARTSGNDLCENKPVLKIPCTSPNSEAGVHNDELR